MPSIFIYRGYDLRTHPQDKLADVHKLAEVTVFLNRRHNLAHVYWRGEDEAWLRLTVPRARLFGTSDFWVEQWFKERLKRWLP